MFITWTVSDTITDLASLSVWVELVARTRERPVRRTRTEVRTELFIMAGWLGGRLLRLSAYLDHPFIPWSCQK